MPIANPRSRVSPERVRRDRCHPFRRSLRRQSLLRLPRHRLRRQRSTPPPSKRTQRPLVASSGVHFLLGAMGGAGPMWTSSFTSLYDAPLSFSANGMMLQGEARLGVLFGRFKDSRQRSHRSQSSASPTGLSSKHGIGAVSAGWMLGLYEREGFSISLPIRARGDSPHPKGWWLHRGRQRWCRLALATRSSKRDCSVWSTGIRGLTHHIRPLQPRLLVWIF